MLGSLLLGYYSLQNLQKSSVTYICFYLYFILYTLIFAIALSCLSASDSCLIHSVSYRISDQIETSEDYRNTQLIKGKKARKQPHDTSEEARAT